MRERGSPTSNTSTSLTTTLGGSATAIGDGTLVTGRITSTATDVGPVTLTSGTSIFSASARSLDGETAYATASTYADAEGEDLLIMRTHISNGRNNSGDGTTMSATSRTSVFALDIEAVDLPHGPITVDITVKRGGATDVVTLDDNVTLFDLSLSATGEDTWIDAEVYMTAMDGLSFVDAFGITIA